MTIDKLIVEQLLKNILKNQMDFEAMHRCDDYTQYRKELKKLESIFSPLQALLDYAKTLNDTTELDKIIANFDHQHNIGIDSINKAKNEYEIILKFKDAELCIKINDAVQQISEEVAYAIDNIAHTLSNELAKKFMMMMFKTKKTVTNFDVLDRFVRSINAIELGKKHLVSEFQKRNIDDHRFLDRFYLLKNKYYTKAQQLMHDVFKAYEDIYETTSRTC